MGFKSSYTLILFSFFISCKIPLNSQCDIKSQSFLDTILFKRAINERSPHCGINLDARLSDPIPLFEGRDKWLDYIKNDGDSLLTANNIPCDGSETGGPNSCFHAGAMRYVELIGGAFENGSCDSFSAKDNFDTFEYTCFERPGKSAILVSTALKRGRYLGDLVEGTGVNMNFKPLKIEVFSDGKKIAESKETLWFQNPLLPVPLGGGNLAGNPGTLYVFDTNNAALNTLNIMSTNTGILFQTNRIINLSNNTQTFNFNSDFQFFEGDYNTLSAINFVTIPPNNRFMLVSNLSTTISGTILNVQGSYGIYRYLRSYFNNGTSIVNISTTAMAANSKIDGNVFESIFSADNDGSAVLMSISNVDTNILNQSFLDLSVSGSTDESIFISRTQSGSIVGGIGLKDILVANPSFGPALSIDEIVPPGNITGITVSNLAIINSPIGLSLASNSNPELRMVFENLSFFRNTTVNVDSSGVNNPYYTGNFFKSGTTTCSTVGGLGPGITNDCSSTGSSDFISQSNVPINQSFVGPIREDDRVNQLDLNGIIVNPASGSSLVFKMENPYRSFISDTYIDTFVDGNRGLCSGSCQIFDWSLKANDIVLRNVNDCPDFSRPLAHRVGGVATSQADCSALVRGSTYIGGGECRIYHLRNSREIIGDAIGNENGLCESNERCLYSPNIGSYQGHGEKKRAFQVGPRYCFDVPVNDSVLSNIKLFQYEVNGR